MRKGRGVVREFGGDLLGSGRRRDCNIYKFLRLIAGLESSSLGSSGTQNERFDALRELCVVVICWVRLETCARLADFGRRTVHGNIHGTARQSLQGISVLRASSLTSKPRYNPRPGISGGFKSLGRML